ncbi:hypothetical protein OI18_15700 [Flavihumibacter solisilvae]|uniref:Uncharacterized protein n=2 Tax=Flavihumibacter solisilvae TaxID=1349421 RepID=A0A0C1IHE2_9BACT|nr:hypothetical protein OI18_15700 [Flavihumibacter solisilvae]
MRHNKYTMKKLAACIAVMLITYIQPNVKAAAVKPLHEVPSAQADSAALAIADQSIADFKALDKKEKKSRFRAVKKLLKEYRAEMRAGTDDENSSGVVLLAILAILVPPLAIYLKERNFTWKFWLSLALMVVGIIFFSSLAFLWLFAAALALLTVFDIL